jgi:hypothetical protein
MLLLTTQSIKQSAKHKPFMSFNLGSNCFGNMIGQSDQLFPSLKWNSWRTALAYLAATHWATPYHLAATLVSHHSNLLRMGDIAISSGVIITYRH